MTAPQHTHQQSRKPSQDTKVVTAEPQEVQTSNLARVDPRGLRPNEILHLQRTIGNAATVRLVAPYRKPGGSIAVRQHTEAASVQRLMTSETLVSRSDAESNEGGKLALAKKMTFGKSDFKTVRDSLNEYHDKYPSAKVQKSRGERADFHNKMVKHLTEMASLVQTYIANHKPKGDRPQTVETFEILHRELGAEREAVDGAAEWIGNNSGAIGSEMTWQQAQKMAKNHTDQRRAENRLGLPPAYAATLDPTMTAMLVEADDALAAGKIDDAEALFKQLKDGLGGTFGLIKSTLLVRHLNQFDPVLHNILTNPKFEDLTPEETVKAQTFGADPTLAFDDFLTQYETGLQATDQMMNKEALKDANPVAHKANLRSTQQWEQGYVNLDLFKKMNMPEKYNFAEYGGNSDTYNDSMRKLELNEQRNNPYGPASRHAKAGGLVSALNRLPPLEGTFYRHDKLFDGFESMNQVGAVLTDLAFYSASREIYTLVQTGHNTPEILTIVKGHTARFTKPGVLNNFAYDDDKSQLKDENEVLFKPATKFRVLERYDALDRNTKGVGPYTFPHNMPPEAWNALNGDPHKKTVKIILIKEEVTS